MSISYSLTHSLLTDDYFLKCKLSCCFSCMRTGTEGSQTAIFSLVKTVWWWCGTTTDAGATYPATTTSHTPARKAPVSKWQTFRAPHSCFQLPRVAVFRCCIISVSCSPIEDLTLLNFFISLMWATAKGPKRLHVRKGSTEIWDWCGRALSLCSGFPAETESSDQVFVWRKVGETPDPLYPW